MITREDMLELAQFQGHGAECAISFYFQPSRPKNKSHREDGILAKDLVRQALREAEEYSGVQADVDIPETAPGGQVLLACAPEHVARLGSKGLQEIGTVG